MRFYHGSRVNGLTMLSLEKSKDGNIYMTNDYATALMYSAGAFFTSFSYNEDENKLYLVERCEDMVKKLYSGRKGYIYTTEDVEDCQIITQKPTNKKAYIVQHDVKLVEKETIGDVYQKIMELYSQGKIGISFWKDMPKERQDRLTESMKECFNSEVMKKQREKNETNYNNIVKLFPYLALDEKDIVKE